MTVITRAVTLNTLFCATCGLQFAITDDFDQRRRRDRRGFYCPSGHSNVYHGKSAAEKRADELAAEVVRVRRFLENANAESARQRDFKLKAQRQVRAHKGVAGRLRRKLARGECPCCSKTFVDLKSHMSKRHPKFDPTKGADAIAAKGAKTSPTEN